MNKKDMVLSAFFTGVLAIPLLPSTALGAAGAAPHFGAVVASPGAISAPVVAPASSGFGISPASVSVSTPSFTVGNFGFTPTGAVFSGAALPGQSTFGFTPAGASATGNAITPANTGIPITSNGVSISTPPGGFPTASNSHFIFGSPFGFGFGGGFAGWPGPWAALSLYGGYSANYPCYPGGNLYRQGTQLVSQPSWTYIPAPAAYPAPNPYASEQCALRTNGVNTTIQVPIKQHVPPSSYGLAYAGKHQFARVIKPIRAKLRAKKEKRTTQFGS